MVLNPELAFRHKLAMTCLWKNSRFTSRVISVVFDEVHCVVAWGSFRPDLAEAGRLRSLLPSGTPYLMPSATLAQPIRNQVLETLQARKGHTRLIQRSNDRPNVYLTVQKLQHAQSGFKDLEFLIPDDWVPERHLRFLVFFDSIDESVRAAEILRNRLPREHQDRVVWFNSDNTSTYRNRTTNEFRDHKLCGLYCTDSFGMVRANIITITIHIRTHGLLGS